MNYNFGVCLLLIAFLSSCNKEDVCPSSTLLGQLDWSRDTEDWFPAEYFQQPPPLVFMNNAGELKSFDLDALGGNEGSVRGFTMECENGIDSTEVSYSEKYYYGVYKSQDSVIISYEMGVRNEVFTASQLHEADFYEWINIGMWEETGTHIFINGRINIVTDLRNSELDEIEIEPNVFVFDSVWTIEGEQFFDLYSVREIDNQKYNFHFQKGKGIIAFRDRSNMLWKLVD